MKTMCPPSYHHNNVMMSKCITCHKAIVVITRRVYCSGFLLVEGVSRVTGGVSPLPRKLASLIHVPSLL